MRRLTEDDLIHIAGSMIRGYHVEDVRIKKDDSGNYGIILGKNHEDHYVTWQFHLLDDGSAVVYNGHYYMKNQGIAVWDFNTRDMDSVKKFKVTITEMRKLTVEVEATDEQQAEQMVFDNWKNGEYIFGPDDVNRVKFEAVPVNQ